MLQLEEGRADLVGLFYLYNPKIQELGLVDDLKKTGMESYDSYIRNGLTTISLFRVRSRY
jgi:dipeptidyl-peptidase-3